MSKNKPPTSVVVKVTVDFDPFAIGSKEATEYAQDRAAAKLGRFLLEADCVAVDKTTDPVTLYARWTFSVEVAKS